MVIGSIPLRLCPSCGEYSLQVKANWILITNKRGEMWWLHRGCGNVEEVLESA